VGWGFWCILDRIFTVELLVYRLRKTEELGGVALIRLLRAVVLAGTFRNLILEIKQLILCLYFHFKAHTRVYLVYLR